jgi:hypothetical protein
MPVLSRQRRSILLLFLSQLQFLLERPLPLLCSSVVLCGAVPPAHMYTSVHTVLQPRS